MPLSNVCHTVKVGHMHSLLCIVLLWSSIAICSGWRAALSQTASVTCVEYPASPVPVKSNQSSSSVRRTWPVTVSAAFELSSLKQGLLLGEFIGADMAAGHFCSQSIGLVMPPAVCLTFMWLSKRHMYVSGHSLGAPLSQLSSRAVSCHKHISH